MWIKKLWRYGLFSYQSIILSIIVSTFVIQRVAIFLRRFLSYVKKYPPPEEYIFARCIVIACRLNEKKPYDLNWWSKFINVKPHGATYQVSYLFEDFSFFCKDWFNVRRNFYSPEFNLLSMGKNQLERMLVFSGSKASKMFLDFSFAFINGNDLEAHNQLKQIIHETEKYGKLQSRLQRMTNQLNGTIALIAGVATLIGAIVTLVLTLSGII